MTVPSINDIDALKAIELEQIQDLKKKYPDSTTLDVFATEINGINPDPNDPTALAQAGKELLGIETILNGNDPTNPSTVVNQPVAGDCDLLNLALRA